MKKNLILTASSLLLLALLFCEYKGEIKGEYRSPDSEDTTWVITHMAGNRFMVKIVRSDGYESSSGTGVLKGNTLYVNFLNLDLTFRFSNDFSSFDYKGRKYVKVP